MVLNFNSIIKYIFSLLPYLHFLITNYYIDTSSQLHKTLDSSAPRTKPQSTRENLLKDNTTVVVSTLHRPTILHLFPGLSMFLVVFTSHYSTLSLPSYQQSSPATSRFLVLSHSLSNNLQSSSFFLCFFHISFT